jgi:hypothetical protein
MPVYKEELLSSLFVFQDKALAVYHTFEKFFPAGIDGIEIEVQVFPDIGRILVNHIMISP